MAVARPVALAVIAAIALAVGAFSIGAVVDEGGSSRTFESVISGAMDEYQLNNELAESAPQQQVVNGWIARDLLEVIALQNVEVIENQDMKLSSQARTNSLLQGTLVVLVLGVISIAILGISMVARRGDGEPQASSSRQPPEGSGDSARHTATTL